MGGRNQNTQPLRSGCADEDDTPLVPAPFVEPAREELDAGFPTVDEPRLNSPPSLADFSALGVFADGVAAPSAASNGFPPALGVLAEPKDANAPEPRPKAVDAPGDARPPPGVVTALKGLLLLSCDELSPPNRLAKEALLRAEGEEDSFVGLLPDVDRESLLELKMHVSQYLHCHCGPKSKANGADILVAATP
jgi:hypothetical protein